MGADLTLHARRRMQGRMIPPIVVDLLHRFGSSMRCGGADRMFFDKAARRRLSSYLGGYGSLRKIENWLDVYMVLGDNGNVVTVGYRTRRFRRP